MIRTAVLWLLAVVLSLGTALFQRMTGPSYPASGKLRVGPASVEYRFGRSEVSTSPASVQITCTDTTATALLKWRRHNTGELFAAVAMKRSGTLLRAELPPQPPAGKVDYVVTLRLKDTLVTLPSTGPVVLRYRGDVPSLLLVPHIVVMFLGMLLAARTGLEYFSPRRRFRPYVIVTIVVLALGGFLLGPAVQKYAFGAWWTGWPFGTDLTDNKTAVAIAAWVIAFFSLRRAHPERWVLGAAIVTFVVYLIPHSLLGSELDYKTAQPPNTMVKPNALIRSAALRLGPRMMGISLLGALPLYALHPGPGAMVHRNADGAEPSIQIGNIHMDTVAYGGWKKCYRLSNGTVDLIITGEVGPRIIRYGFIGKENQLKEFAPMMGKTGGSEWRAYGGHRLWNAPEDPVRTYAPDNDPVDVTLHDGFVRVTEKPEPLTGIEKEIDIALASSGTRVTLTHRLRNTLGTPQRLAPWALTVLAPGGRAIFPLPPRGSHPKDLLPVNMVAMWAYTNMQDPRWRWGEKYIMLQQDTSRPLPQKLGLSVPDGWAAYASERGVFVKRFGYQPAAAYPDFGSCTETWTNNEMLELETLGPFFNAAPGAAIEHREVWYLFPPVGIPASDADVDRLILPRVRETKFGE